jgi:hypothetical protein
VSDLLNVHNIDPGYGVATWDRLLIQLWRGPATLQAAERWLELGEAFLLQSGDEPCSSLSIVESRSPPPTEKVRLAMAAGFRGLAPRMRHQVVVAEGSVMRSALVRGVGLALSTLSSSSLPLEFVASLNEAAVMLAPDLSPAAGGVEGLKGAVSNLRSQVDKCQPR